MDKGLSILRVGTHKGSSVVGIKFDEGVLLAGITLINLRSILNLRQMFACIFIVTLILI